MVSEIEPGQTFYHHLSARQSTHPDAMGENNTRIAFKSCGVKILKLLPWQKLLPDTSQNLISSRSAWGKHILKI